MSKHIKVQATPVGPDFQTVNVQILEQTHRGRDFGKYSSTFTHAGYTLESSSCPQVHGPNFCFMQGSSTYDNNRVLNMPVATFTKFKAAVEAYNKEFAGPAKTVAPKHIKLEALPIGPDFQNVRVKIIAQTNDKDTFGISDAKGNYHNAFVTTKSKIRLASCDDDAVGMKKFLPKSCAGKGMIGTFYCLRNKIYAGTAAATATVTAAEFAELKKAVEAYNDFFKDYTAPGVAKPAPKKVAAPKKAPAAKAYALPKAEPCAVIVG